MNDASHSKANTLDIVNAATRIVSAMDGGGTRGSDDHRRSTARSIDTAIAKGVPLDDAFVARTVWEMTRGTHSRAYESVMPEHGPLISRAAALKTHPDDLKALADGGWASGVEDIPTFSRMIDGAEWRMTHGSDLWRVTRHTGLTLQQAMRTHTAAAAIRAIDDSISVSDGATAKKPSSVTASAEIDEGPLHAAVSFVANARAASPAESATGSAAGSATVVTMPGVAELIAEGRLPQLDAAAIQAAAYFITEARLDADRSGKQPDPALIAARNAIFDERAVRAEQARLMEGWTDEATRESRALAMRGIAEQIVKLKRFANVIDEDDGIAPANRAQPVEGGREEFDRLAGSNGVAAPARLYVVMRQAQRRSDDATVRIAAAYCEYANAGVVTHDEAVTALISLRGDLTKRMRDGLTKRMRETMQKSGREGSLAVATTRSSGVAAYGTQSLEQGR